MKIADGAEMLLVCLVVCHNSYGDMAKLPRCYQDWFMSIECPRSSKVTAFMEVEKTTENIRCSWWLRRIISYFIFPPFMMDFKLFSLIFKDGLSPSVSHLRMSFILVQSHTVADNSA